jgi:hypothetical protein
MGKQDKPTLKSFFQTGFKPTQQNFADLIESFPNKDDDGINTDGSKNISLVKGISLGNSTLEVPGSLRWNGADVQFRDNTSWKNIGTGGGSQWTSVGADVNMLAGKVGIGLPAAVAPTAKFEVIVASGGAPADQIRLGSVAAFLNANVAYLSHVGQASTATFALSQDSNGRVALNCTAAQRIEFKENNVLKATINGGALCMNASVVPPNASATPILLFVNGEAAKPGGGNWFNLGSDERVKKDITLFKDGLARLKKLKPVNYKYNGKAGIATGKEYVGLIAQDVQKVCPYMVGTFKAKLEEYDEHETELLSLDTNALTYVMVNAIQELDTKITKLEKLIANQSIKVE